MTFSGRHRGPAWEVAARGAAATAPGHGVPHPADAHAHGHAHEDDHEISHGPAEPHDDPGHGHGPWHGPHESPAAMTGPLLALAVGAALVGFFGVPEALAGGNGSHRVVQTSVTDGHREPPERGEEPRP